MIGPYAGDEQPYPEPVDPPAAPPEAAPPLAPQEEPPAAPFNDGGRPTDASISRQPYPTAAPARRLTPVHKE